MSRKAIREFTPMKAVTGRRHPHASTPTSNPNYKGDMTTRGNQNAVIDDAENCKVYINRLPRNVTYAQLLGAIRGCGKVKACHINPPDDHGHVGSDATVTFFSRAAALALVRQNGSFGVGGTAALPQIRWNRQRVGPEDAAGKSRVLRITGNSQFVNLRQLTRYFQSKLTYNLEKTETIWGGPGMAQMDWYFSGWAPQAQAAKLALEVEYPDVIGNMLGIRVETRHDPCSEGGDEDEEVV